LQKYIDWGRVDSFVYPLVRASVASAVVSDEMRGQGEMLEQDASACASGKTIFQLAGAESWSK
jgi:hypothetical protein